ncbi:MAG TPA: asparagine synthetase B family protein [Leptolyngbya sp.]|jgi:asparagine synthase (glutamine-hydrolysing)|nr:asparagine synthetase B family protein [Leptolyngbya sp.]
MMLPIDSAQFQSPHQFVGYWGLGQPAELERKLRQALNQAGIKHSIIRRGQCAASQECSWSIAYLGLESVELPEIVPSGEAQIAALFAGGIATNLQSDGLVLPDAWVRLMHHSDGTIQLSLGRDRFGRVPLYWTQKNQTIGFASQMQLLLEDAIEIDLNALYGYTCFSYVPTPLTPVQGIQAVPAGVQQLWRSDTAGNLIQTQHRSHQWQQLQPAIQDEQAAIAELQTLLKDAISRQVADLADDPVGIFLSGGLDSSIVAALLVQMGLKVRAYSLDFGVADRSELSYAKQVAEFLNIPLVTVEATPQRVRRAIAPTAKALDLPFGDAVTVPLFLLNQAAAQEVAVVFNGEHGDQLFAGWTNKPLIAAGIYRGLMPDSRASEDPFYQQYLKTFHRLHGHEPQIFQPNLAAHVAAIDPIDWLREALDPQFSTDLLHRLRRATLMLKGAQNIQPRATALAFAHGLKVRSPFCDLPLAEWAFRLSGELCLQGSCEKYILKRAVESWLPSEIVWRSKRGMGVPLTSWCLHELWHDLGVRLNPAVLRSQSHWQPDAAAQIVSGRLGADIQGRRIGESLWLILMWQAWHSSVFGENALTRSWNHPFWLPPALWRKLARWQNF